MKKIIYVDKNQDYESITEIVWKAHVKFNNCVLETLKGNIIICMSKIKQSLIIDTNKFSTNQLVHVLK